jgi:murein DD-endopeptidase MepM/ murein hydrolase activator NlpD
MRAAAFLVAVTLAAACWADYPRIGRLDSRDPVFRQLQQDIEAYHLWQARGDAVAKPVLTIFAYEKGKEDLFALSARVNLPYETLATANGLSNPADIEARRVVLVPNMPGVFVPAEPGTDFEQILLSSSQARRSGGQEVVLGANEPGRRLVFYGGERFNPVERAFFLRILFRFPLGARATVSSMYGTRTSPFTGHPQFHNGIDLAAPVGTPVVAARDGTVAEVGEDTVLGRFIRLSHEGGYETVYGHLSETLVSLNQAVHSGIMIAKVGSTGQSTGPHLHFELRRKGAPRDPLPMIRMDQR